MLSIPDVVCASVIGSAARSETRRGSVARASKASLDIGGVDGGFVAVVGGVDVGFSVRVVVDGAGTPPGGTFLPPPPCTVTLPPSGREAWTGCCDLSTAAVDDSATAALWSAHV